MSVIAKAAKKRPGFSTPLLRAYKGKKAVTAPQVIVIKKAMMAGGSASRLKKGCFREDRSAMGRPWPFFNLRVMNRQHKDKPVQTRKRTLKLKGKLNWFMRSIPK